MSDNLSLFLQKVSNTPALQEKLTALQQEAEQRLVANLVALSTETGTPVSAEEWIAARAATPALGLSDDDLSAIAGGTGTEGGFGNWWQYIGILPYMIANPIETTKNPQHFRDGMKKSRPKKSPIA